MTEPQLVLFQEVTRVTSDRSHLNKESNTGYVCKILPFNTESIQEADNLNQRRKIDNAWLLRVEAKFYLGTKLRDWCLAEVAAGHGSHIWPREI